MITVTPRSRIREDRAGDPLDGLVNLFDLGIVLAVAFLLAALSSLNLTKAITKTGLARVAPDTIQVAPGQTVKNLPAPGATTVGRGTQVGTVYQLPDGSLVYVTGPTQSPTAGATPTPGASPTDLPSSTPSTSTSTSPSTGP
jgi:hypothetical protein